MRKNKVLSFFLTAFMVLFFLVSGANGAVTVSEVIDEVWGGHKIQWFNVAFDSSYAAGGEAITKASRRFSTLDKVIIIPKDGYIFEYDLTNEKLLAFAPAPPVVVDEQHTITNNQFTLNYPAAYIMAASLGSTGAVSGVSIYYSGASVDNSSIAATSTFAWGTRPTFNVGTDLSGTIYVTYVTQAWKDVWDNRVENESQTANADYSVNTASTALAIENVAVITGTTTFKAYRLQAAADYLWDSAVSIDFTQGSGNSTHIGFEAGHAPTTVYITYIQRPADGFLVNRWREAEVAQEDEDGTGLSYAWFDYGPMLLWGYAGQVPSGYTTVGRSASWREPKWLTNFKNTSFGGNLPPTEAYLDFFTAGTEIAGEYGSRIFTGATLSSESSSGAVGTYIYGLMSEIPGMVPLEVPNGTDLSDISGVQVIMIGR